MKVLKSGVEMTPKELENIKGSGCACGCNYKGFQLYAYSLYDGACYCNCDGSSQINLLGQGGTDAKNYI